MDPEQVYQEVLQEEQQKGVSAPVAEGRAKAARARAEAGSPHPKEPKWWPGSQPHLEGAEAPAAEAAPAEAPAAEAPAEPAPEEAPAEAAPAEATAAEAPADPAPAEAPAETAPAEAPAEPEPAEAPAAQPAAQAAPGTAAAPARPPGVIHGVETGTRLRPEDAVAVEAQFEGQRAMYERRKLIDELIATGVPAVAAEETGRERSALSLLLYVVIPLMAIVFVVVQAGGEEAAPPPAAPAPPEEHVITAEGIAFDTDELRFDAGETTTLTFRNDDPVAHNVAIYETEQDRDAQENALFEGSLTDGGATGEYEIPPLEAGEYLFHCQPHPSMNGTVVVE